MWNVLNDWVVVERGFNDDIRNEDGSVLIYLSDGEKDDTNLGFVRGVGPKCKDFTKDNIGDMVLCPIYDKGMFEVMPDVFFIRESVLLPATVTTEE